MNPYRMSDNILRPEPLDFAYHVFASDPRVIEFCKKKFELPKVDPDDSDEVREEKHQNLKKAVLNLWHIAKDSPRLARHERGYRSQPELVWYDEARILSERVGKRWETTPIPTLVEALSNDEMLHGMAFPEVKIPPDSTMVVTTQAYCHIRVRRLVLGSEEVCKHLFIENFKIGKNSQFINACAIPGICFSNVAFPFRLKTDTCSIHQTMTLVLRNGGKEVLHVTPAVFGLVIEEHYEPLYFSASPASPKP